jgi:hypothetical protein
MYGHGGMSTEWNLVLQNLIIIIEPARKTNAMEMHAHTNNY